MQNSLGLTVVCSEHRVHVVPFILPQMRPDGVSLFSNASEKQKIVILSRKIRSQQKALNGMDCTVCKTCILI